MSIGSSILNFWHKAQSWPGGRWIFSKQIGRMVPYSGSIHPFVEVLEPGHAIISLQDRRKIRNHLGSIHAIALCNLGELCSGMALLTGLPESARGIVTNIEIEYSKKARGTLIAKSIVDLPKEIIEETSWEVQCQILDRKEEEVAKVKVTWQLGPRPEK